MLESLSQHFFEVVTELRDRGLVREEDLKDHVKGNLHSWLQCAMIEAGRRAGFWAVPEVKIRFDVPLDPNEYGLKDKKRRKRFFSRVDVAFYSRCRTLLGISEIFTMDEAHGCLATKELAKHGNYYLTPKDSLPHLLSHGSSKPRFLLLVVTSARESTRIFWETRIPEIDKDLQRDKDYYTLFKPKWKALVDELPVSSMLLLLSEKGLEKA